MVGLDKLTKVYNLTYIVLCMDKEKNAYSDIKNIININTV